MVSPINTMLFKSSVYEARFKFSDWLETFQQGHKTLENANASVNIVQSMMVMTTVEGKSIAPFLESALFRLDANSATPVWITWLLFVGCLQLIAVTICSRRGTYLFRLIAAILASFTSFAILLALISGPQPWIVAVRYGIPFGVQTFVTMVLIACHRSAQNPDFDASAPSNWSAD